MSGLHEPSGYLQVSAFCREVPVCEITNELEQGRPEVVVVTAYGPLHPRQEFARLLFELIGAEPVAGIGQEECQEHRAR